MTKSEIQERKTERMSDALSRQLKGVLSSTKLAQDAAYDDNYKEALLWLQNVQDCITEASSIASDLRDKK